MLKAAGKDTLLEMQGLEDQEPEKPTVNRDDTMQATAKEGQSLLEGTSIDPDATTRGQQKKLVEINEEEEEEEDTLAKKPHLSNVNTAEEAKDLLEQSNAPDADALTRGQQKKIENIHAEKSPPKKPKLSKNTTMAATEKVKLDTLVITTDEGGKILKDALTESEELQNELHRTMDSTKLSSRKEMRDMLEDAPKQLGEIGAEKVKNIADAGTEQLNQKEDLRTQENKTLDDSYKQSDDIYKQRKHELQQDLAHHYLTRHDSMPLSPLMPKVDDKRNKFYLAFKMNKVDTKSSTKSVQTPDSVDTYKALFYNGNVPHRNIYIQGEAGIGKSTFCTKLGLVWSENMLTECSKKDMSIHKKESKHFSDENIMHEFDFVFSLALRNVQRECEIETMIQKEIINGLPNHTKYAGLVWKILDKERCLIVLDGLDEWLHRRDVCKKSGQVPHRKSWSNTTVLTSTRPWKMNEVCLRDYEICILVQITGITNTKSFTEIVLNCLNDKYNINRGMRDFIAYIKDKQLEHFLDIPVIAMQLLCLWHSGHEPGDSKCQRYINMLDMLLGRAKENSLATCDDTTDNPKTGLSLCFESTVFCKQHKVLLGLLGSLAFHTLHSSNREESLVFSESIVKSHVKSPAARKTALTTGILSQHKSPSRNIHFSFLHKTFQEFLAAFHIATHADESENIVQTLNQVYVQTLDMDISEIFIFVCGLNTEMSSKISDSLMKSFSVKLTNHIEELCVSGGDYNVEGMTKSLQEMILAGYKESISNGHRDPQLALHHVYYHSDISDDDKIYRDRLVDRNIDKIVTLSAYTYRETNTVDVTVGKIQQKLAQSSSTLSHISLPSVDGLTDACLDLSTCITLKSLRLFGCASFDIKLNTSSLLYCYLEWINEEVAHSVLCALTAAPQLHTLEVRHCVDMSVLCQVLPTLPMLHTLYVVDSRIPACLCQVLSTLSQLQRLTVVGHDCEDPSLLCQALSTLSHLQYIKLKATDLGDNDILLPNSIQEIVLDHVKLTGRAVRQLVDRRTQIPHKVTCTLEECIIKCIVSGELSDQWRSGIPL